ncbi:MAG: hypothetical protein JXA69_15540 [Phycisphaerae bacterium]|nr:hypothetical protein [Phycisphaerae bacterium]
MTQQPLVTQAEPHFFDRRHGAPPHDCRPWWQIVLAAAASGALMAACYWPLHLHFLAWIALVPWLYVMPGLSPRRTWLFGTVVGLVFYRIGLAWMFGLHGPLAGITIVGLAVWMGFSFRVAGMLIDRFGTASMLWAVPLTFVGQEVLRSEALPRFRFSFLAWGYSQSHNIWVAQIASVGGVYSLSFLLVMFSAAIAYASHSTNRRAWLLPTAVAGMVFLLATVTQPHDDMSVRNTVAVACVQAETESYDTYADLTHEALNNPCRPHIVVLPEHTIYDFADERHALVVTLRELAHTHGAFICVGAHTRAPNTAECYYDNVAMLIGPDGHIVGQQAKAVPLPFFQDGNPARDQATTKTVYGTIGLCVCYDALFTDVPRRLVDLGAEVVLVPVMDPERWPEQERRQHADMAVLRSIELRRASVRAASSGVSQIIDPTGQVQTQRSRTEGPGFVIGTVVFRAGRTLFVRGGYLFAPTLACTFLAVIGGLTIAQYAKDPKLIYRRPRPLPRSV